VSFILEELDDDDDEREEYGTCCMPDRCCMPGMHYPSECHDAEMLQAEEMEIEQASQPATEEPK
jgi:hypothetical protein